MGVLGGSKKVYVSSVVYNLAGDIADRADFLKSTVFGKVVDKANSSMTMGEHITKTYLDGPGIKLRSFARWSRLHGYSMKVGMTPCEIIIGDAIDDVVLKTQIPLVAPADDVMIQTSDIGVADYTYWADQYMLENYPTLINTDYVANFDGTTITILFEDLSSASFIPTNYDPYAKYLYVTYTLTYPAYDEPVVTGDDTILDLADPFPSITGWDIISESDVPTDVDLITSTRVQVVWSDTTPGSDTTTYDTITDTYDEILSEYEKITYKGQHPTLDATWSEREVMFHIQEGDIITEDPVVDVLVEDMGGGVTRTTTTTVIAQTLEVTRKYRIDTQEKIHKAWGPTQAMIYKQGSGNATLDAMFGTPSDAGIIFPIIPVRINNQFVSNSFLASDYPWVKKATRRALNITFDKLVGKIADNPSLGDIDYAFAVFGVSLNSPDMSARAYLYEFFRQFMLSASTGTVPITGFEAAWDAANASIDTWTAWKAAQEDPLDPLFDTVEPTILQYPSMPSYMLRFATGTRTDLNFNYVITWAGAAESVHVGIGRPGAKVGDYWIVNQGTTSYPRKVYSDNAWLDADALTLNRITIYYQHENNAYKQLNIYNLHHRNNIYGSKTIEISASEALSDADESGFIVPLHEEIFKETPLVEATQMATACVYMVFNCIKIVKQKWYETTLFKIIVVIVIIIITVVTAGAGIGLSGGLLGANAAVGAALGFTGVAAAVVGALANALAALIVSQIIQYASTAIFGEKVGAIIGMIASVIAVSVGTSFAMGGSITSAFADLMSPSNLLKLTAAAGEGYATYLRVDAAETSARMGAMLQDFRSQSAEIENKYRELFGTDGRAFLDPLSLTNVDFRYMPETSASFLTRTMLTGSDIAELSTNMPTNFLTYMVTPLMPTPAG